MLKENIFPLVYIIIISILLCIFPYVLPSFYKYNYIKSIIKILLFIYIVQLSAIVHELAHTISSGIKSRINIPKLYYIPFIGFKSSMNVYTQHLEIPKNIFITSISGFITQFIYLLIMTLIFFKANTLSIALTSTGFVIYLFIYIILLRGDNGNDFKDLV